MSSIFHIPPDKAEPFSSEKFVALTDAVIERMSQTHGASTSMCSLMDMITDEHKRLTAALIVDLAGESTENAMFVIRNVLHSLAHLAFEFGIQYEIESTNALGEIDFNHLLDGESENRNDK